MSFDSSSSDDVVSEATGQDAKDDLEEEKEKDDDEISKFAKVDFPAQDLEQVEKREEVTETAAVEQFVLEAETNEQEALEDVVFVHEEDPNAVDESASCLQMPTPQLLKSQDKESRSESRSDEEEAEAAKRDKEPKGPKKLRR